MHPFIEPVYHAFTKEADPSNASSMKAYMLNKFEFWGIKTVVRDQIVKGYLKDHTLPDNMSLEEVIKELWEQPQREMQYFAIDLFVAHKKLWSKSSIKLIEHCITNKSWWDTVDGIASDWLGAYFKLFSEQTFLITSQWNKSNNIWLQRSSILFQKSYKKNTDTALLASHILHCKDSKEFFIRKAIGWALREYSKTNPEWVITFVSNNKLSPLSEKEALKRISN
ncbi:MAG: DNA alkylation repair protein [Bacteroidota bacterium]